MARSGGRSKRGQGGEKIGEGNLFGFQSEDVLKGSGAETPQEIQNGQKQAYDAVGRHVKAWGIERNGEGWGAPLAPNKKTKSVRIEIVQDASSGEMEKAAGEYA